jgi:DeoR/GlpR family transcriptional regulator of sugar metabolism
VLPSERRRRIVEVLAARPSVGTEDLAREFGVSAETVRRDLLRLQHDGLVERVHGGALPVERPHAVEDSYDERREANAAAKQAMAALATSLLQPGDTVVFDVGTSVLEVARRVPPTWSGRVLTNSLPAAAELSTRAGVEVLVSGGRLRAGDQALAGPHATAFFTEYYADLAFLGSGGVDAVAGLTDYHPDEVDVRRAVLDHADRSYVLADATKLGAVAARRVCALGRLTGLVSDAAPDAALAAALRDAGTEVLTPAAHPDAG